MKTRTSGWKTSRARRPSTGCASATVKPWPRWPRCPGSRSWSAGSARSSTTTAGSPTSPVVAATSTTSGRTPSTSADSGGAPRWRSTARTGPPGSPSWTWTPWPRRRGRSGPGRAAASWPPSTATPWSCCRGTARTPASCASSTLPPWSSSRAGSRSRRPRPGSGGSTATGCGSGRTSVPVRCPGPVIPSRYAAGGAAPRSPRRNRSTRAAPRTSPPLPGATTRPASSGTSSTGRSTSGTRSCSSSRRGPTAATARR